MVLQLAKWSKIIR